MNTKPSIIRYYNGHLYCSVLILIFCLFSGDGFARFDTDDEIEEHRHFLKGSGTIPKKETTSITSYYDNLHSDLPAINMEVKEGYLHEQVLDTLFLFRIAGIFYKFSLAGWLFITACLVFGCVLIMRQVHYRKIKAELKELATENEIKALRAQINPHFIQNTFDIVAQQIQNGQSDESINIIKKVSAYFRQVLNKSEKVSLSLEDELEFTEDYLKIQQTIRPDLFTYKIDLSDNIDSFDLQVPSMLLQPVVENCIRHGFAGITTGGEIIITIKEENGSVAISIKDNGAGIGTTPASKDCISKGIALTQKRIMLIYEQRGKKDINVTIANRTDGVKGAEFRVSFPI